ncbi:TolC family protein [Flavobacterium sp. N1718]|uniref:TolC family protein n=1 Tax=Flavobacterium sp. N1718 TaxID=2986822 RepID=UPI0029CAB235|nr:TolC family protein [Flavobacterium sp. N1718]
MNMKTLVLALVALSAMTATAQQKSLSVKEAVALALQNSNETQWAATKVATKGYDLQTTRNNLYPDFKLTGQYLRLTNANVRLPASQDSGTDPANGNSGSPKVNSLAFGQAAFNLPVFAGGRLRHSIEAADNLYKSEQANAAQTKEEVAIQVIKYYAALYKAQRSVETVARKPRKQRTTCQRFYRTRTKRTDCA